MAIESKLSVEWTGTPSTGTVEGGQRRVMQAASTLVICHLSRHIYIYILAILCQIGTNILLNNPTL
jgi:hypothetical protein